MVMNPPPPHMWILCDIVQVFFSVITDLFSVITDLFSVITDLFSVITDLFSVISSLFSVYRDLFSVILHSSRLFSVISRPVNDPCIHFCCAQTFNTVTTSCISLPVRIFSTEPCTANFSCNHNKCIRGISVLSTL